MGFHVWEVGGEGDFWIESQVSVLASGVDGGAIHRAEEYGNVWVWGQDEEFDFGHI